MMVLKFEIVNFKLVNLTRQFSTRAKFVNISNPFSNLTKFCSYG